MLLACFFLTGCASNRIFLRKNQRELRLEPNEGAVLFSFRTSGQRFRPLNVHIQEINQYKPYRKKAIEPVQLPRDAFYGDKALFSIKLPQGTYKLVGFGGLLIGGLFPADFYIPYNKVFDVSPEEINYIGALEVEIIAKSGYYEAPVIKRDLYKKDLPLFSRNYPILQWRKVNRDLIY